MKKSTSSPLLTDLYQLTMAYGYWKLNMHEQEAVFHLLFRNNPFKGNYVISCGLADVVDYLTNWHFSAEDLSYLATLKNARDEPLFPAAFLAYLRDCRITCDLDAAPEGTLVFPHAPILRIKGPLLQCQLVESALLNIINFQSLIATKASRIYRAAMPDPVIEFGLRRAQGPDGALSASRAAYIGGCIATSNVLAGKIYDIPLRGTHAHSWVTAFPSEQASFAAYVDVMPHNCVLLVDTYDSIEGVKHAITAAQKLKDVGADLIAVRLDSGDMASLSIKARALLDEAGFTNTGILASNSLDEYAIQDLKAKGAAISSWGVGTNLVTAYDHPALDGVYKLSALKSKEGVWEYKLKLSEQVVKVSNPGCQQVRRYFTNDAIMLDIIFDEMLGIEESPAYELLNDQMMAVNLHDYDAAVDLLKPVLRAGVLVDVLPSIHDVRESAISEMMRFCETHPCEIYPVGLEKKLFEKKVGLIDRVRIRK